MIIYIYIFFKKAIEVIANFSVPISLQESSDILKTSYSNFASLVQNILNVPLEKELFFQVSLFKH